MNPVKTFLQRNSETKVKITVVGDAMIDEYHYVTADRVSPEFPIPVMLSSSHHPFVTLPGGAANVVYQFKRFNVETELFSFIDANTFQLYEQYNLKCHSPFFEGIVPIKRRVYQRDFPLCRWDIEQINYGLTPSKLRASQEGLLQRMQRSDTQIVVFSDYGKGVFENGPDWIPKEKDWIAVVDPKKGPIEKWKGCDVFKPNAKEAKELSGISDWKRQCKFFAKTLGCSAVIITQGGEGVVGSVLGREFEYRPKKQKEAQSVIGAGDCFVAFLAMGLAHSMDIVHVTEIAYEAGSVYVNNRHNAPIYPHQISPDKFVMPETDRDYSLVFTNGCFDILHLGHVDFLRKASEMADKMVVALNTDESVKALGKGVDRPINSLGHRKEVIAGLEFVDFVVEFNEETPYNIIQKLNPNVLVKGADWKGNIVGSDIVEDVRTIPLKKGLSTTNIVEKIRGANEAQQVKESL